MDFALFKLKDSAKLTDPNLYKEFETPERANGLCVCKYFFHDLAHLFSFTLPDVLLLRVQAEIEIFASIHVDRDCC